MTCMAACKDLGSGREKERKHRRASYFATKARRRGVGSRSKSRIICLQKSARSIFLTNMPADCFVPKTGQNNLIGRACGGCGSRAGRRWLRWLQQPGWAAVAALQWLQRWVKLFVPEYPQVQARSVTDLLFCSLFSGVLKFIQSQNVSQLFMVNCQAHCYNFAITCFVLKNRFLMTS